MSSFFDLVKSRRVSHVKRYAVSTGFGQTFVVYASTPFEGLCTVKAYCQANGLKVVDFPTCEPAGSWDYHLNQAKEDPTETPYRVEGKHA